MKKIKHLSQLLLISFLSQVVFADGADEDCCTGGHMMDGYYIFGLNGLWFFLILIVIILLLLILLTKKNP